MSFKRSVSIFFASLMAFVPSLSKAEVPTVRWDPPTQNIDGSPLGDLSHFLVSVTKESQGTTPIHLLSVDASMNTTDLPSIAADEVWFVTVGAVDEVGNVSAPSNEIRVVSAGNPDEPVSPELPNPEPPNPGDGGGDTPDTGQGSDTDADGIPDLQDNCPTVANPEQAKNSRGEALACAHRAINDFNGDEESDLLFVQGENLFALSNAFRFARTGEADNLIAFPTVARRASVGIGFPSQDGQNSALAVQVDRKRGLLWSAFDTGAQSSRQLSAFGERSSKAIFGCFKGDRAQQAFYNARNRTLKLGTTSLKLGAGIASVACANTGSRDSLVISKVRLRVNRRVQHRLEVRDLSGRVRASLLIPNNLQKARFFVTPAFGATAYSIGAISSSRSGTGLFKYDAKKKLFEFRANLPGVTSLRGVSVGFFRNRAPFIAIQAGDELNIVDLSSLEAKRHLLQGALNQARLINSGVIF